MKKVALSFYDVRDGSRLCNTRNLHGFAPYDYDASSSTMFVDRTWFSLLSDTAQSLIRCRLADLHCKLHTENEITVPHVHNKHAAEVAVYHSYIDSFDYQNWCGQVDLLNKDVVCVPLSGPEKAMLAKETRRRLMHEDAAMTDEERACSESLFLRLSSVVNSCNSLQGLFLRLSGTSGKNKVALEPLFTVDQVWKRLTNNSLFLHQEYEQQTKNSAVIIMPWRDGIEKRNEFRVFFCDGRVTGVSQQHWYECFSYSDDELDAVERAITEAFFLSVDGSPFAQFVADVWVSFENAVCHLIEYNPFGAHSGAGSSLFEWVADFDQLYGRNGQAPELRFTTILSCQMTAAMQGNDDDDENILKSP